MTETKTPNAGEWWISDDGSIIRIVGVKLNGGVIYENQAGFSFQNSMTNWRHEPRCTSFDWVEPSAEVWPKWIIADHWSDTAFIRRDSADENSSYTIYGKKRKNTNCKFSHAEPSIDSLIANKTWRYATEVEALARVQHPTLDPDDIPLNPVLGTVVATGTVTLTPVESPEDWVEFDSAQITCPRISIDWLTLRLGESQWGPASSVWSKARWAEQREIWKIRCRRCDLPMRPDDTQQVRELTQRIGDLVQQVNQRDAVIEGIRTALRQDFV